MRNSTATDVTFGGGWCDKRVEKQEECYSIAIVSEHDNSKVILDNI